MFREKVRELVMYMSDDFPMWLKRKIQKRKKRKKSVSKPRGCRKSFLQNLRDSMRLSRGATLRLLEPILKNAPFLRHKLLPILKLFAENAPN